MFIWLWNYVLVENYSTELLTKDISMKLELEPFSLKLLKLFSIAMKIKSATEI